MITEPYSSVPNALKNEKNWVLWRMEEANGRKTKIPYGNTGGKASSTDDKQWFKFNDVKGYESTGTKGVGFCFNGNGICGIDLDHCLNPDTGEVDEMFRNIVDYFSETYQEKSPSGKGLHIIFRCDAPPYENGRRKQLPDGRGLEVYSTSRYFTVSGNMFGKSTELHSYTADEVKRMCDTILNEGKVDEEIEETEIVPVEIIDTTVDENCLLTDDEILEIAYKAKNGKKIKSLMDGELYGFPSFSEADMSLASLLCFYTTDKEQVARIMWTSGFAKIPARKTKWEGKTYLPKTIAKAMTFCKKHYIPKRTKTADGIEEGDISSELTEVALAEKFVQELDGNALYNISTHRWHVWTDAAWEVDNYNTVYESARRFLKSLFARIGEVAINDRLAYLKCIKKLNTKAGVTNVVALAAIQLTKTSDDFDSNIHLLNVKNGTLYFIDGEVKFGEHKKSDMCSYICGCDYDKKAAIPSIWLKHIETITGEDKGVAQNLQEILGYTIDGGNKHEYFAVMHGSGRNGKSVTLRTVQHILGNYAINVNPLTLMENGNRTTSPERIKMMNKRLIIAQEPNKQEIDSKQKDTSSLDAGFLKAASGKDKIPARELYSNDIKDIQVTGLIVFSTNPLPKVNDNSIAFWERIVTIPFGYVIPGWSRDSTIEDKFKAKASGILNWLIAGWKRTQEKRMVLCDAVKNDIAEYRASIDPYAAFCNDRIVDVNGSSVKAKDLYAAYLDYEKVRGGHSVSETIFGPEMSKRYNKKRTTDGIKYLDIKIKTAQTNL